MCLLAVLLSAMLTTEAAALPALQLYLEGGEYDESTESWTLTPDGSSAGQPFRLWAIGDTGGGRSGGLISDVHLAVAYDNQFGEINLSITPTVIGGDGEYLGLTDSSVPDDVERTRYVSNVEGKEDRPQLSGIGSLGPHGIYENGTAWQEFALGDFTKTDSPNTDFNETFPGGEVTENHAQINAYDITVFGADGGSAHGISLHFDLYGAVQKGKSGKAGFAFAPFSHDAHATTEIIPLPAASMVGFVGFAMLGLTLRRRPRQRPSRSPSETA